MKRAVITVGWLSLSIVALLGGATIVGVDRAQAQVIPDGTLPTTVNTPNTLDFTIEGGTRSGNNLFHSFSQFSVPNGGSALFNNATDIQTIFARVTGGSASNIDGRLTTNGTASLFLLNPSGILLGANARLNLGGSFVGTTANSIQFADGTEFSALNSSTPPLLTMSAPVGLQMGANAAPIQVEGPAIPNALMRPPTIALAPTQTLALVGGQIDINSANLSASDGRIELWAVGNGRVAIDNPTGWKLTSPADTATWGTITLRNVSSVDATGANGGAINIRGRGLTVQDGSNIGSMTFAGQGKGITVNTTDFIDLMGSSLPDQMATGIGTGVGFIGFPAFGRAGDVTVETGRLRLFNGAWLQSTSNGNNSRSGDVRVRASDIEVVGSHPFIPELPTSITTTLFSGTNNEGGKITVEANRIRIADGGMISTAVVNLDPFPYPTGKAGDIEIRATESLDISGYTVNKLLGGVSSGIGAPEGQGGNISIETGRLKIWNGGTVRSSLSGSGKAGNITIKATEVAVSDPVIDVLSNLPAGITVAVSSNSVGPGGNITLTADRLRLLNGGQITSSSLGQGTAGSINLEVQDIDVQGTSETWFNGQQLSSTISATSTSSFAAGSVNLRADRLNVRDGARITVSNTGTGDAGNLNITAGTVFLNNGASLQAAVNGGSQGNIQLQVQDLLLLRQGSDIVTSATGASTGGNIKINAPVIVGLENSDIVANAVQGQGGNIQITTQGIIGLQYRDRLTPENDITASSEFGVNGTVEVNNVGVDPNSGLVELSTNLVDTNQQVTASCSGSQNSRFVVTGRGGMPPNPTQDMRSDRPWKDVRDLSTFQKGAIAQSPSSSPSIAEATTWHHNPETGKVELVATTPTQPSVTATCATPSQLHSRAN